MSLRSRKRRLYRAMSGTVLYTIRCYSGGPNGGKSIARLALDLPNILRAAVKGRQ